MSSQEITESMSERNKLNDYLATIRLEENQNNIGILKDIIVYPVVYHDVKNQKRLISDVNFKAAKEFTYNFNYICKVYVPIRDSVKYIYVSDITKIMDLFMSDIKLNNNIDKKIQFKREQELKIKLKEDSIGVIKKHKKHLYSKKELNVKDWLPMYDSLFSCLNDNFNNIGRNFDTRLNYISVEFMLTKNLNSQNKCLDKLPIKVREKLNNIIKNKRNSVRNNNVNRKTIIANINEVSVNNDTITLYIEAEHIMHENKIKYVFEKPDNKNSEFVKFIKEMNVYSVDELEMLSIKLTHNEYHALLDLDYNGWYIKKRAYTKKESGSFIHNLLFD